MIKNGRLRAATTGFITCFVYLYSFIALAASTEYGVPIEIKLWDSQRSPLSHMVDVTNEFGLKVLAEHNFLNNNNIAFSPYGLMGILVALYEGVDGESSYQIQRSMQLPWNRNVMRIGFRDIHRTLKTYFVPEEGFLAGLALNNENVTFNEPYVKILRFYGFDLESEQASPKPPESGNITTMPISNSATTTPVNNINTVASDNAMTSSTVSTKEETTPSSNVETVDVRGQKEETLASPISTQSTILSTETTTSSSAELAATTQLKDQTVIQSSTTLEPQLLIESSTASQITESPSTEAGTAAVLIFDGTTTISQTTTLATTIGSSSDTQTTIDNLSNTISEATTTTDASSTTASSTASTLETLQRRRKSIIDFVYTGPPYIEEYAAYRSFDIGSALPESSIDYDKMFSVNGLRNIEVTYMHYDSVLDHAFLPHLEASALRLPLDSEKYYLLVVLPMRRGVGELERLLARMARESDLSDIYSALRPCRVRAAVPSFIVKGHITLTTDLQKLGIRDVFEPRQHDFTPMTHQAGVYVRSIEQAVSVAIRKYQSDPPKAYIPNPNVVYFSATYPFLYFVMDANINVALMAGKMVDPLNTRIL